MNASIVLCIKNLLTIIRMFCKILLLSVTTKNKLVALLQRYDSLITYQAGISDVQLNFFAGKAAQKMVR